MCVFFSTIKFCSRISAQPYCDVISDVTNYCAIYNCTCDYPTAHNSGVLTGIWLSGRTHLAPSFKTVEKDAQLALCLRWLGSKLPVRGINRAMPYLGNREVLR